MRVHVEHSIGELAADCAKVPVDLYREGARVVKEGARVGGNVARDNARRTVGKHGKHYPSAITWDRSARAFVGFGGGSIQAEYGPDPARRQGGMSFEFGSRNQPPHLDLAKSADLIGPAFAREVSEMVDGLFWPGQG